VVSLGSYSMLSEQGLLGSWSGLSECIYSTAAFLQDERAPLECMDGPMCTQDMDKTFGLRRSFTGLESSSTRHSPVKSASLSRSRSQISLLELESESRRRSFSLSLFPSNPLDHCPSTIMQRQHVLQDRSNNTASVAGGFLTRPLFNPSIATLRKRQTRKTQVTRGGGLYMIVQG
jgi:hypothetical protein